jgi:hypothetical protein
MTKHKKQLVLKWTVSQDRYTQLLAAAKSFGCKSVAAYVKMLVEAKLGKME